MNKSGRANRQEIFTGEEVFLFLVTFSIGLSSLMSNNRVCTRLLPLADGSLDELSEDHREPPCADVYTCAHRRPGDTSIVYAYANGQMAQVDADANELYRVQVGLETT
jgi:hypothetical protein